MGQYTLDPRERERLKKILDTMTQTNVGIATSNYGNFCDTIKNEDPTFYRSIQHKLREAWEEFKRLATDILEGIGKVSAAVIVTPIVGIVEGLSEGFEKGLEAGVEKAFDKMGSFLDDLFK